MSSPRPAPDPRWLALDAVLVIAFATIGRRSHEEGLTLGGIAHTAWPFLAGVAVGWALLVVRRVPAASLAAGLVVWPATVVVGMLLRALTDAGTAPSFVVVATVVTGVLLLGWRLVAQGMGRRSGGGTGAGRSGHADASV